MINNFDLYEQFIKNKFQEEDTYFVIELIRCGKDNPNMPAANYHFKNYYIRKPEDINKYKDEIIQICDLLKMRAYGSVCSKSLKKVTLHTLSEIARRVVNDDFNKPYTIFESCSGKYSNDKCWMVDVDNKYLITAVVEIINNLTNNNELKIFPTKAGAHIITKPFNTNDFTDICTNILQEVPPEIHKNGITLLYA